MEDKVTVKEMNTRTLISRDSRILETDMEDAEAIQMLSKIVDNSIPECQYLTGNSREFATDMLAKHRNPRFKNLTSNQIWWIHKLVIETKERMRDHMDARSAGGPVPPTGIKVGCGDSVSSINAMFESAKSNGLKWPKIRFDLPRVGQVRLSMTGPNSRYPGCINITDGGPFGDNVWYGRVDADGSYVASSQAGDSVNLIAGFLKMFARNPAVIAGVYGQRSGNCCFCGISLTDKRSLAAGYGPICADKFNLPWGELKTKLSREDQKLINQVFSDSDERSRDGDDVE